MRMIWKSYDEITCNPKYAFHMMFATMCPTAACNRNHPLLILILLYSEHYIYSFLFAFTCIYVEKVYADFIIISYTLNKLNSKWKWMIKWMIIHVYEMNFMNLNKVKISNQAEFLFV